MAVNRYEVQDAPGAEGELFRSILRQRNQFQGIWMVSPDGEVLAWQYGSKDGAVQPWTREVLIAIDRGLKAHGRVSPRALKPAKLFISRGQGVQPDGSVILALSCGFERDGYRDGPVVTEGLNLSAQEWAAFVPPQTAEGTRWVIPASVARRFCRALSPYSEPTITPQPDHVKAVELTALVESVRGQQAQIRLTGKWETELIGGEAKIGKIRASATADGIALYDVDKQTLGSFLLVFSAEYRHIDNPPQPMGAVIEWRAN